MLKKIVLLMVLIGMVSCGRPEPSDPGTSGSDIVVKSTGFSEEGYYQVKLATGHDVYSVEYNFEEGRVTEPNGTFYSAGMYPFDILLNLCGYKKGVYTLTLHGLNFNYNVRNTVRKEIYLESDVPHIILGFIYVNGATIRPFYVISSSGNTVNVYIDEVKVKTFNGSIGGEIDISLLTNGTHSIKVELTINGTILGSQTKSFEKK